MKNVERLDALASPDHYQCLLHLQRYFFAADHAIGPIIADVACGTGYGSFILALHHPDKEVVGYDISKEVIEKAEATYKAPNLKFHLGDAHCPPGANTIVSLETLEHLDDWILAFKAMAARSQVLIWSVPWKQPMTPVSMMFHRHFGFCDESFRDFIPPDKEMCSSVQLVSGEIVRLTEANPAEISALVATLKKKGA